MRKTCRVQINGQEFTSRRGEILLDAALASGIDVPHDCRAGQCGTCKVKVLHGLTVGGDCGETGMVKACQARVITDLDVMVEPVPEVLTTKATVMDLTPLAPDVMDVRIKPHREISYLPGQYYKFQFRGFPARYFSPTAPMDRPLDGQTLCLHVRRIADGIVSPALGRRILPGHPVTLHGPFGSAYYRPNAGKRLILIGSGTGFAPIWSIAASAIAKNPRREMVVIVGAKTMSSLYMAPAFRRLSSFPHVTLIPTVSEKPEGVARIVRKGRPTDHMPRLTPDDVVYACGAPDMVDAVKDIALAAGATFYADPFTPHHGGHDDDGIVARAVAWLSTIVPVPGWAGGDPVRMLCQPKQHDAPQRERQQPRQAYRSPPHRAPPPSALRPNRGQPLAGVMRPRNAPMQGHGAPAE